MTQRRRDISDIRYLPELDQHGKVVSVLGITRDITSRKCTEEALRTSEERYKDLSDYMNDGVAIYRAENDGEDFVFIDFNKSAERIDNVRRDDLIGKSVLKIFPGVKDFGLFDVFKRVWKTGKSEKYAIALYEDERISGWRDNFVYKVPSGEIVAIYRDETEKKQAEEALKISRENLLEESNQRKILSKRLIDLLEKDRHDIAMELHDNIGQILTSLKINLEIIDDKLKPIDTELGSFTKAAIKRANQAINDLNNIAHGLMPGILDALGLVSSLHSLLNEFRKHTDIKIDFFNRNVGKRFDKEKEIAIYRIVQEALNNIIKHAKAKNVYVSLLKKGNVLSLSVEDNGVGFDQDKAMKISKGKGPLGLVIMRERAMQLDGELTIESKMGKGTHLLAEVPI